MRQNKTNTSKLNKREEKGPKRRHEKQKYTLSHIHEFYTNTKLKAIQNIYTKDLYGKKRKEKMYE